jgi:predicted nucleic acid-binding protein
LSRRIYPLKRGEWLPPARNSSLPSSFLAEIGNAFLKKIRQRELSREGALVALESACRSLILHSSEPLSTLAFEIATNNQSSFYDAFYAALAQQEDCQLITADERLVNAVRSRLGETNSLTGRYAGQGRLKGPKAACYDSKAPLGSRLVVGQRTLDPYAGVRILPPQPLAPGGIV